VDLALPVPFRVLFARAVRLPAVVLKAMGRRVSNVSDSQKGSTHRFTHEAFEALAVFEFEAFTVAVDYLALTYSFTLAILAREALHVDVEGPGGG
jgi:hypothetical protein